MAVRFNRTAIIERGKRDEALQFAATISEYWQENFGLAVTWGVQIGGTLGTVHWYSDHENMAQLEEAFGFAMSDEGYLKLIADAQDLFAAPPEDTIVYTM